MADLTSRVADLVKQSGGSVNAAAKAIGIPQQTLDRIVRGQHRAPRVETLQRIADFYETTVDWLLTGRGEGPVITPGDFILEKRQWFAIAREVAGDDKKLQAVLEELPRSLELASDLVQTAMGGIVEENEDTESLDILPRGRPIIEAWREERAAWVKLFRAWIDYAGVDAVRKDVRRNQKRFANRFVKHPQ